MIGISRSQRLNGATFLLTTFLLAMSGCIFDPQSLSSDVFDDGPDASSPSDQSDASPSTEPPSREDAGPLPPPMDGPDTSSDAGQGSGSRDSDWDLEDTGPEDSGPGDTSDEDTGAPPTPDPDPEPDPEPEPPAPVPARTSDGLMLYYPFVEGNGRSTADQSQARPALNLTIEGNHRWLAEGGLQFLPATASAGTGRAYSNDTADRVGAHLRNGNPFSVEVWTTLPASVAGTDYAPGRLFSLARGGQSTWSYDYFLVGAYSQGGITELGPPVMTFRFYNSTTAQVEILVRPPVDAAVHYVLTYDGRLFRIYQNGVRLGEGALPIDFQYWSEFNRVRVGNSAVVDRQYPGRIHLIAMYDRALSLEEIEENFQARWP
jgi:hypothetical protein